MISMKWPRASIVGAMAVFALAGSIGTTTAYAAPDHDSATDDSDGGVNLADLPDLLLNRTSKWKEGPLAGFPALPNDRNLIPFSLDHPSDLKFQIDSQSITVSKDGVVRYTVVIDTPSGTRNTRFEGIHCASYRWRLYSGTNSDGTAWDNASTPWTLIEGPGPNDYHATLATNYFCDNKTPVPKVKTIVEMIRYGRSLQQANYR